MKVTPVNPADKPALLALMEESHRQDNAAAPAEWARTLTAINTLLDDPQAGEACLIFDEADQPVGYMIMCRGFSLDYGGYFTWIEETYLRKSEQKRFRDQRFSP
jgi:hypothetical protein